MDVIEPVNAEAVTAEFPNSRFRVVDNANLAPGVCALCGSAGGDGRQFIDFGKTVDWYGCVYFCTWCIGEAAKLLGLGNIEALKEILSVRSEKYQETLYRNAELKEKLDAAMVLVRNCTCSDRGTVTSLVELPETFVCVTGDPEPEPEPSNGDESDADKSNPVEGPDDISGSSGNDESEFVRPVRRSRKSAG